MGNCVLRGLRGGRGGGVVEEMVKVVTTSGGIMELYAPITAECITNEFPGQAIFPSPHHTSPPLLHNQRLRPGQYYYLLPHKMITTTTTQQNTDHYMITSTYHDQIKYTTPYRMSAENQGLMSLKRTSSEAAAADQVFPRINCHNINSTSAAAGVWKVRLVICPDQLSEILSQEARTEALIESLRTVAKCASTALPSPTAAYSEIY